MHVLYFFKDPNYITLKESTLSNASSVKPNGISAYAMDETKLKYLEDIMLLRKQCSNKISPKP
jgi:hypothetical protein